MCLFSPNVKSRDEGPFLSGEWAVYTPLENFLQVSMWFEQHRNGFSVLSHPNSGCLLLDHSEWAFWMGDSWQVNTFMFPEDNLYNPNLDVNFK